MESEFNSVGKSIGKPWVSHAKFKFYSRSYHVPIVPKLPGWSHICYWFSLCESCSEPWNEACFFGHFSVNDLGIFFWLKQLKTLKKHVLIQEIIIHCKALAPKSSHLILQPNFSFVHICLPFLLFAGKDIILFKSSMVPGTWKIFHKCLLKWAKI